MKLTAESTVLDDKKIGDSFATLQVDADGIRTEVGRKVGNDEVISRINQSPESIQIQANKVAITGTTVFNAVNSDASAKSAMLNSEIEVGGRNLIRNTKKMEKWTAGTRATITTSEEYAYVTLTGSTADWNSVFNTLPTLSLDLLNGTEMALSFEYKASADWATSNIVCAGTPLSAGSTTGLTRSKYTSLIPSAKALPATNTWTKAYLPCRSLTPSMLTSGSGNANSWYFQIYLYADNLTVNLRKIKLEYGNKATDWTPAPEDATSEEQYVYATYVSGSTSATAPSNWVTETGDKQNTWTTKRPTYNSTYPVLFVCKQTKTVGGDVTSTTPLKDDTTTVIDGGHITTGTIDTNRLNANTIKSNIVQTTDLSADRITSGNIAADRIKANVISAINSLTAGQIDAARIKTSQITVGSLSDGSAYSTTIQMDGAIDSAVNGVQVGGTNMLIDSTNPTQWDFMTKSAVWTRSLIDGGASFNVTTAGASDSWGVLMHQDSTLRNRIVAGQQYNISFDIRYNATIETIAACNIRDSDGTKPLLNDTAFTISFVANQWKHISVSYPAVSTLPTLSNQRLYISIPALAKRTGIIDIKNAKVEVGNKGTDWSPAPEDAINENLLVDSQKMSQWVANTRVTKNTSPEIGEVTLNGSNSDWNCVLWSQPLLPASILDGSPLWLSFEYTASATTSQFRPNLQGSASNAGDSSTIRTRWKDIVITLPAASSWTKYSVRMPTTVAELTAGSGNVNSIYLGIYLYDNVTVKLRKLKLEHGNAPTKWSTSADDFKTYITRITDDGISIHAANNATIGQNYVILGAGGLNVYNQGSSVAFYGQTARVGKDNSKHASIDTNGFHVWDGVETTATNEIALFGSTARIGKTSTRHVEIKDGGMQVYEDSTTVMGHFGYGSGNNRSNGTSIAPYFTLGKRGTTITTVGNYSVAEGDCAIASGYSSHAEGSWVHTNTSGSYGSAGTYYPTASDVAAHAEGEGTLASESAAHAEGVLTVASGYASHAEGNATIASTSGAHAEGIKTSASGTNGSHAEGFTTVASGEHAHAEGAFTTASGDSSHAGGYRTTATRNYQTVIGKYNRLTGSGTAADPYIATNAAFIVGGGVTTTGKDLLTVDWSGNTVIAGTLTQSSDRRLKEHISYVGDEAIEFIDGLKPAHYIKDGEKHLGFYAQDVAEVDKWDCIIGEEMNGYMTLGYMELLAPMVAYIQRLEKRIEELERSK